MQPEPEQQIAIRIDADGILRAGKLVAIVVYNGHPTYYTADEMNNTTMKEFLGTNRVQQKV